MCVARPANPGFAKGVFKRAWGPKGLKRERMISSLGLAKPSCSQAAGQYIQIRFDLFGVWFLLVMFWAVFWGFCVRHIYGWKSGVSTLHVLVHVFCVLQVCIKDGWLWWWTDSAHCFTSALILKIPDSFHLYLSFSKFGSFVRRRISTKQWDKCDNLSLQLCCFFLEYWGPKKEGRAWARWFTA